MKNKCLYCYEALDTSGDFHPACSKEFFGSTTPPQIEYTLSQMAELAKVIVERSVTVPGVQAKLSMSLIEDTKGKTGTRLKVLGAFGGQYIFKPPNERFSEMPENEHVTMRMAEAMGIRVVPTSLIRLKSGELSYITKRIDRTADGEKIHMLDMFQITEAYDKYKSSMEKVGKALHTYSDNTMLDKIFFLEIAVFSFLSGNNDMHLKNFSMIESSSGWVLAPSYDLLNVAIILPEDAEELALTIDGKKKKLNWEHFEKLGLYLGLTDKQIQRVKNRMFRNKTKAVDWLNKSFLSSEMKEYYRNLLEIRYDKLK
jgi:serine/threonine-protein kinase HipA